MSRCEVGYSMSEDASLLDVIVFFPECLGSSSFLYR